MGSRDLHIDAALSNVSVSYNPGWVIADIIAPIVPVGKESDKYYVWERDEILRTFEDLRADGGEANLINFKPSKDTYFCEEYALKIGITNREKDNADSALRLEISKTKFLKNSLLLSREKRVATIFRDANNYATGFKRTLSGTSQWNNASYAGDPLAEIDAGINAIYQATWMFPNVMVMPYDVAQVFGANAKVLDRLKYTNNTLVSSAWIPQVIRNMQVLMPGAIETTSARGAATIATGAVWWKDVILAITNNGETMEALTKAYTFRNRDFQTEKYYKDENKTTYIETSVIEDVKNVSDVAAYIMKAVIS